MNRECAAWITHVAHSSYFTSTLKISGFLAKLLYVLLRTLNDCTRQGLVVRAAVPGGMARLLARSAMCPTGLRFRLRNGKPENFPYSIFHFLRPAADVLWVTPALSKINAA